MERHPDAGPLTDLIYGALFGERTWTDFLVRFSRTVPNGTALLFFHDAASGAGAFPLSSGVEPHLAETYSSYYSGLNPWMPGATRRPLGRVVRAEAMLAREQLVVSEFYNDWLRPQGLETGIGVTILRDDTCNFLISVLGADADDATYDGATALLQDLVPHLRRAFNQYRQHRSGPHGLFGGEGVIDSLHLGVVNIGSGRRVQRSNAAAKIVLENGSGLSIDCSGRLRCTNQDVEDCIDAVLDSWLRDRTAMAPRSFLLSSRSRHSPVRLTVIAPPDERHVAFFRGPECLLLVEPLGSNVEAGIAQFAAFHRLTAAETRVVAGLAAGGTVSEIAADARISAATVRTQLKQIFAKTGLNRQADLVRHVCLLAGFMI